MIFMHVDGQFTDSQEKRIVAIAKANYGKFEDVTDKGAVFAFDTHATAQGFKQELRAVGFFATETE